MGKGKATQPSKKTEQKMKEKIIEDKTFGLKNKNKSTKVQKYSPLIIDTSNLSKTRSCRRKEPNRLDSLLSIRKKQKRSDLSRSMLYSLQSTRIWAERKRMVRLIHPSDKKGDDSEDEEEEVEESVAVVKNKIDYYNDPRVVRKCLVILGGDIPLHSLSKIVRFLFIKDV